LHRGGTPCEAHPVDPVRILELRSVVGAGGGPEKTILLGTERTDRDDFDITVCYLRHRHDSACNIGERAQSLGIKYVEITERASFDPVIWRDLAALVGRVRPHIVHSHEYKSDLLGWLLARRFSMTALSTAHGWTGHSMRERYLYYPADKRLLARFRRVIAVSGEIRTELLRCGARPERIKVILNGIDHRAYTRDPSRVGEARERFGVQSDAVAIGSVGRLEPQKRLDRLVDAMVTVCREFPECVLLIAGDGSKRNELENLIDRRGLRAKCRLLGHVSDIKAFHHALDLFVQSSDYEGTPNAVLEAMAMGTPVVATDAGGTTEMLSHMVDGLIAPQDSGGLADAINNALSAPARRDEWRRAARRRVETELSFDARMRQVEAIYFDLVGRTGREQRSTP
jgi:glycosyltransferase involved in cell wall biosynthesis